jgi:hypothetical protein
MVALVRRARLLYGGEMMNSRGALIALAGTVLSLPVLSFARRYLHGEFMFGRFSLLSVGLTLGFNLVATAPTLSTRSPAGRCSASRRRSLSAPTTNGRRCATMRRSRSPPTSCPTFAFLCAIAYAGVHASFGDTEHHNLACAGLLLAALLKSSQFPLVGLFARSMEGPTPASALGYAGLSAHVGVVLLTSTMPIWFVWDWARVAVAGVGLLTAVYASLIGRIRADRKGALANATSSTLGLIFVTLALGYADLALRCRSATRRFASCRCCARRTRSPTRAACATRSATRRGRAWCPTRCIACVGAQAHQE